MKPVMVLSKGTLLLRISALLWLSFLILPSCQKDDLGKEVMNADGMYKSGMPLSNSSSVLLFGPETFTIASKNGVNETRELTISSLSDYENLILKVQNGSSGRTKVTKMQISIDDVVLVTYKDFKGNLNVVSKDIAMLSESSKLNVRLEGSAGRFVTVQIEGTLKAGMVSDYEGNHYKTVLIFGRWWMAENLRATKFNDGTPIPEAKTDTEWIDYYSERSPAYCWYNNDPSYKEVYGALYNYAIGDGEICPDGWHIPDSHDYFFISLNVDPDARESNGTFSSISGGKMKEAGTEHWQSPNTGATNSTGYTGLPGGQRGLTGLFSGHGYYGIWWSDDCLSSVGVVYDDTYLSFSEGGNEYGHSIRCIKNE
jgi:uncharacterized protein (TIGR02145 family)